MNEVDKQTSSMGTLDSFDRAKVGYDKMDAHEKAIWNAAIENAASIADAQLVRHVGHKIRRLKK